MKKKPDLKSIARFLQKKRPSFSLVASALPLLFLLLCVLSAAVAYFAYQAGKRHAYSAAVIATDYKGEAITVEDVQAMRLENDLLKAEMAALIQERDISMNNLNALKDNMQTLKESYENAQQLNEQLIALSDAPLEILSVNVKSLGNGIFEYRVDIFASAPRVVRPKITLLNETAMAQIPTDQESYTVKGALTIRGQFIMPTGFAPRQIKIELLNAGKDVVQLYDWQPS